MGANVACLMWMRTTVNYQYRTGSSFFTALKTLYADGGIPRFYRGVLPALVQGPLSRFGDTAANVGILAVLQETAPNLPLPLMTAAGSITAGLWRILLMPIDSSKTVLQVEGSLDPLWGRVSDDGFGVLYRGALAQAAATAAGHFPWFLTYNALESALPIVESPDVWLSLVRSAVLGFSASCVSDCVSNSLRVIKTTRQTSDESYPEIVRTIVEQDGVWGLLGRGLQTRLLTNAIQGALFSVLWRYFQQMNAMS